MHSAVARHALDVNYRNLALGHQIWTHAGATFVRDRRLNRIYDANFVYDVTVSTRDDMRRLIEAAEAEYADAERLTYRCDSFSPPAFEAHLALSGFQQTTALVLLLQGSLPNRPVSMDIRDVSSSTCWEEYRRLKRADWKDLAIRLQLPHDDSVADDMVAASQLKSPPARYLLAYQDGQAVGYCQSWRGIDGFGQVEDLFVEPAARRRGVATALLYAAVGAARAGGAGPIVIVADPADTPKQIYAALGWEPVALTRQWARVRPL